MKNQRSNPTTADKIQNYGQIIIFTLLLIGTLLIVNSAASAATKFKDVPQDHWAASSVYDLVKLGVTKGYPDGTFRGTKKITRYETAILISKLAKSLGGDVKSDLAQLKQDIAKMKSQGLGGISGSFKSDWMFGNLLATEGAPRGGIADYRLILTNTRDFGNGSSLKVNLDTMDYGYFNNDTSDLAKNLIDITSKVKLNLKDLGLGDPVNLLVSYGPGGVQHTSSAEGVLPSEVGRVYNRPDTQIMADTKLWGFDVATGFKVLARTNSASFNVTQLTGSLGYNFKGVPLVNDLRLETKADYVASGFLSSNQRDIRGTVALAMPLGKKIKASGTLGLGGQNRSDMMVAGQVELDDVWETGTVAMVRVAKVGSSFIDSRFAVAEFDFAGLDVFKRPLENATVNFGGALTQKVADDVRLVGKGEMRLSSDYKYQSPKGRITAQGGVSYDVAPNTTLDAMYRVHQDKTTADTSDLAAVGLQYNF